MAEKNETAFLGCLPMFWQLFVTLPLFLAILYGVIQSLPASPQWLLICFYVYVPSVMLGAVITGITTAIIKASK